MKVPGSPGVPQLAGEHSAAGRKAIRILHVSIMRSLSGGQRKQLGHEQRAAKQLEGVVWHTLAIHDQPSLTDFEKRTPKLLRRQVLRSVYGWGVVRRLSRNYDFVLVRHSPFDVAGAVMSLGLRNRISVHHSLELAELPLIRPGVFGRILALVESVVGGFLIRRSAAVLGVTDQIADYEVRRAGKPDLVRGVYPNAVIPEEIGLAEDARDRRVVNAVFICGRFSLWHGLDLLVEDAAQSGALQLEDLRIHLVGTLTPEQRQAVSNYPQTFIVHGYLEEPEYRAVLAKCDVAVGSLALARQGITEGSNLKMGETIAMGLAIYGATPDVLLPSGYPYFRIDARPSLSALASFGREMKAVPRSMVRKTAAPHIAKGPRMIRTARLLDSLLEKRPAREALD